MKILFITEKFLDVTTQSLLAKILRKKVILGTMVTALKLIDENNINRVIFSKNIDTGSVEILKNCHPELKTAIIDPLSLSVYQPVIWF